MSQSLPLAPSRTRVALVGCGQIADAHLSQLRRLRHVDLVGVCDVQEDLAWQAAQRFQVKRWFTNLDQLLDVTQPDIVHVATPAHTHAALAIELLEAGRHVYLEKPFALNAAEAEVIVAAAQRSQRLVCVGHDQLFDPLWLRCRAAVESGLIGEVRRVESVLGYPLSGAFGAAVSADPRHWVRRLPGGLFQNTISHPLYRITDLLPADRFELCGTAFSRPGFDFATELHLSLFAGSRSASLTFSTQLPPQRITRVYGSRGSLEVDFDAQTLRRLPLPSWPGAFAKLQIPLRHFADSAANVRNNVTRFARGEIHYFAGMKTLFEQFQLATQGLAPHPVPDAECLRVTRLMDQIFEHCRLSPVAPAEPGSPRTERAAGKEAVSCR